MQELTPQEQRELYDTVLETSVQMKAIKEDGCKAGRVMHETAIQAARKDTGSLYKYLKVISVVSMGLGALFTFLWRVF